jgi:hypothetical protein
VTDILLQIGAKFDGADKVNEQLNKLDRSLDENIKAVNKFDQEFRRLERAKKKNTVTTQGYNAALQQSVTRLLDTSTSTDRHTQSMERNTATMQRGQRVTLQTGSAQQVLRQRFLETANSIAVLDGPLGGVASRFSSFGVLVGRTGVLLAGASVAFAGLSLTASRGIKEFAEFEVQVATVENRLRSASAQINLTSQDIVRMTSQIALGSLASEKELLSAASQVLTFGNITTEVFEDVLRASTDLAASGFGTVESSAMALSKALEDPRQSLTSLSRSGITFTRQQRAMVISMVETGRQAEAMSFILEQVNRQVGGSAEAQARSTVAGQFDTIGQAVRLATREFGQFVLETLRVNKVLEFVSDRAANYIESMQPQGTLSVLRQELSGLRQELSELDNQLKQPKIQGQILDVDGFEEDREAYEARIAVVIRLIEREKSLQSLQQARQAMERRQSSIDTIQGEIESRRQNLFLSEEQIRVNRELASQGFGEGGLEAMASNIQTIIQTMRDTGASGMAIERVMEQLNSLLGEASVLADDLFQSFADQDLARQFSSTVASLEQQNELQRLINDAMSQGATGADARRIAEEQLRDVFVAQVQSAVERLGLEQSIADNLVEQVTKSRELRSQSEALTEERRKLDQATGFLENLEEENRVLDRQLELMEGGLGAAEARRRAEAEIERQILLQEKAYILAQAAVRDLTQMEVDRLNVLLKTTAALEDREAKQFAVDSFTGGGGTRGGGGSSGPDAIEKLQQQLDREVQLLQVFGQQRLEMEARFRVYDAMTQAGITLSEQQQQSLVDQIMLTHQLKQAEEDRIETQRKLEQAQQRAADRMTNLFMAATQGGDAFKQTLGNIIQELARMAAMRAFQSIIGGSSGSVLTSIFGFANGGVFQGGRVKAFAKGGVVDSPTMFPMKGATGLMGEAGPEAIIPLKRGRDGSLGVQGGMTNAVSVTYAPQISVKGSGEEVAALRQEIARMNAEAPARIISTIQKAQKKRVL